MQPLGMADPTNGADVDGALTSPARLAALRATGLLDAEPCEPLDRLARAATGLLGVPIALVTLVDDRREWFAGTAAPPGWAGDAREAPLTHSFGRHVVTSGAPLAVDDAAAHPLGPRHGAAHDLGVRAYLGVPLTSAEGETVGALCAIDTAPRAWTAADAERLTDLAAGACAQLRLRECQGRFRLAVEATQEVVYTHDYVTGNVVRKGAVEAIYGCSAASLAATSDGWLACVHADDRARVTASWQAALARGTGRWACEYRMRHDDGTVVVVQDRARIVRDARGTPQLVTGAVSDVTLQRVAEAALGDSEARLRLALAVAGMIAWERDLDTDRLRGGAIPLAAADAASASAARLAAYGEFLAMVHPDDRAHVARANADAVARRGEFTVEYRVVGADGSVRWHHTVGRAVAGRGDGPATRVVGVSMDVTERVQLEAQLRQAQKMEAVGRLAGGVAHDFNNLLTVITGNLEFLGGDLLDALPAAHPARGDVAEIRDAAARAQALVRQLLTFSRKNPVRPQRLDVAEVVRRAEGLLRRVIGEEITLAVHVADGDPPRGAAWAGTRFLVHADAGQLEQVLLNLAANARDAMLTPRHGHSGAGGTLEIAVDTVALTAAETRHWAGTRPGAWVRLRVRDTGHGMDAEAQAHAFEPFYTTKEAGAGTGIGLATVFGIVREAGGVLRVDSAPGGGTTLTILLPAVAEDAADGAPAGHAAAAPESDPVRDADAATVLLVEDEDAVRATARRILEGRGCTVLEARHGAEALLVWAEHGARIDAVVTDLRMPELGGRELAARLHAVRPGLPVVYMSGYADQAERAAGRPTEAFVQKPFTGDALAAAVGRVLHAALPGRGV